MADKFIGFRTINEAERAIDAAESQRRCDYWKAQFENLSYDVEQAILNLAAGDTVELRYGGHVVEAVRVRE